MPGNGRKEKNNQDDLRLCPQVHMHIDNVLRDVWGRFFAARIKWLALVPIYNCLCSPCVVGERRAKAKRRMQTMAISCVCVSRGKLLCGMCCVRAIVHRFVASVSIAPPCACACAELWTLEIHWKTVTSAKWLRKSAINRQHNTVRIDCNEWLREVFNLIWFWMIALSALARPHPCIHIRIHTMCQTVKWQRNWK